MATSSQTKRRSWASQARPVVAALSGACLTLGLSIANLQAGRFATTAVSFAVSTFIGLVLGGVMSRIAAPRLRQALMLATMVGAGAALVVANAPNAQAQDNACAVRVNIAGNQLTANPTGNMIGSTDRPLRLELEAGSIDALINTGRRFDTVVMRARPLRPLGGAEINFDGQALRLDGTQAAASLRVASQGGDLRLIVDDRDYPAPPRRDQPVRRVPHRRLTRLVHLLDLCAVRRPGGSNPYWSSRFGLERYRRGGARRRHPHGTSTNAF